MSKVLPVPCSLLAYRVNTASQGYSICLVGPNFFFCFFLKLLNLTVDLGYKSKGI